MNTTHVEHDALGALRAELTMAAGRRIRRRRARRRTVVILALVALLLTATAATAALIGSSTGVPAVDALLDIEVPKSHQPAPGSASQALKVPEGDHRTNVVAYRARDGSICVASADVKPGGSVRGGFGGCPPLRDVNRRVQRRGGIWFASAIGAERRTNQLLVGGDVRSVRPLDRGDWHVLMTPPWTPRGRDGRPLRLVVTIDEADIGNPDDGLQMGELPPEAYNQPDLKLTYRDGHARVLHGRHAK